MLKVTELWNRFTKRHRCSAFVASTKAQCAKEVRFGKYCWHHTPKTALYLAVVSAVFGMIAKDAYRRFIPSSESRRIVDVGHQLGTQVDAIAELGATIENLNVLLYFSGPVDADRFQFLDPVALIRLSKQQTGYYSQLEVAGQIMEIKNAVGKRSWGLFFRSQIVVDDAQTSRSFGPSFGIGTQEESLRAIALPLSVRGSHGKPFSKVRDLKDCTIDLSLSPELARSVQRIELVANSTYGFQRRFRLFSRGAVASDWMDVEVDGKDRFDGKAAEKVKMGKLRGEFRDLSVNLDAARWETNSAQFPEMLRVPYQ
jgi:hypothetical protein